MGNTRENRFTVHQRLAASEARLTTLEAENKTLRQWVDSALSTKIKDSENIIHDAVVTDFKSLGAAFAKAFAELKASVKNGVDGKDGAPGERGPRGDVLIPNESEAQAALKEARLNNARRHAEQIARIVDRIEFERTHNLRSFDDHSFGHFTRLLASIQKDIEALR